MLGAVLAFLVFGLLVAGVVGLIVYSLFLKRHGESDQPAAGWAPTDERFVDPGTGRTMRVWVDTGGGRHYVPEQPA